jgi:hypothetical protein
MLLKNGFAQKTSQHYLKELQSTSCHSYDKSLLTTLLNLLANQAIQIDYFEK